MLCLVVGLALLASPQTAIGDDQRADSFSQPSTIARSQPRSDASRDTAKNDTAKDDTAPRDVFVLPDGFQVERLFSVPKDELGSWVA